jgi:hypothetical protein
LSIIVYVLHHGRQTHTVQHSKVNLQIDGHNIMLNATTQYSDIVYEGKVVSIERITTQAIRRNGCQNERM